jgi:hypothetical protein
VSDAATARPASGAAPWRADLTALEQRLRADLQPGDALGPKSASVRPPASDAEVLRRVRALLDESERRQERELALRIGQALRDVSAQRTADLDRIQRSVGFIQNTTGIELLKQRQQIDYIVRTSQRQ